jgi:hypothetical protein
MSGPSVSGTARGNVYLEPRRRAFVARDWRPVERNTLRGFLTLELPSGLGLRECSLHAQGDRRWIGLPGRPQLDADGRHRVDPDTGKRAYVPVVEIHGTAARERFQQAALAAVDRLLEGRGR